MEKNLHCLTNCIYHPSQRKAIAGAIWYTESVLLKMYKIEVKWINRINSIILVYHVCTFLNIQRWLVGSCLDSWANKASCFWETWVVKLLSHTDAGRVISFLQCICFCFVWSIIGQVSLWVLLCDIITKSFNRLYFLVLLTQINYIVQCMF